MVWFILAKVFALSVEKKSSDMKKQKKKQEKLVMKMLPKVIVEQVMKGDGNTVAETFDSATLYFSSVAGFVNVSKKCRYIMFILKSTKTRWYVGFVSIKSVFFLKSALQVVKFLNKLYTTMDKRMDNHDVYKVETIQDQYLVVSGVPKKNGDA